MNENKRQKFGNMLGTIAIAAGKELNDIILEVYFNALKAFSLEEVERAGTSLMKSWVHPGMLPTPGQFIELIQGDLKSNASEALATLQRALGSSGAYQSVAFQDRALARVVEDMGGWTAVCQRYRLM